MKRKIKPHKGGRTERLEIRVSPLVKDWLLSQEVSASDWIEAQAKKAMQVENMEYQGVLGWVEKES